MPASGNTKEAMVSAIATDLNLLYPGKWSKKRSVNAGKCLPQLSMMNNKVALRAQARVMPSSRNMDNTKSNITIAPT